MEANNSINGPKYLKAKKKVNDIRGFYIHAIIYAIIIPVIIYINLEFVPDYHWFWYSLIGMSLGLFFHWLGVLGLEKLGLGKDWEEKKIKELMEKEDYL